LNTSKTVMMTPDSSRRTLRVSSAQRWNTPAVPDMPMPSTISAVIRKGTRSGTGRSLPCKEDGQKLLRIEGVKHYLVKCYPKVDMYNLSCHIIQQNIGDMSISKSQNMPDNRRRRDTSNVVQSHREPWNGNLMFFREIMAQNWSEFLANIQEQFQLFFWLVFVFFLNLFYLPLDLVRSHIIWMVSGLYSLGNKL